MRLAFWMRISVCFWWIRRVVFIGFGTCTYLCFLTITTISYLFTYIGDSQSRGLSPMCANAYRTEVNGRHEAGKEGFLWRWALRRIPAGPSAPLPDPMLRGLNIVPGILYLHITITNLFYSVWSWLNSSFLYRYNVACWYPAKNPCSLMIFNTDLSSFFVSLFPFVR